METVLLACTFAAFALTVTGAPTYIDHEEVQHRNQYPEEYQYLRHPRSQYASQYALPCASAAAAVSPVHLPAYAAPYHVNVAGYSAPQYGYGGQRYRAVDEQIGEPEMLAFSDVDQLQQGQGVVMDHVPMARSGYGIPIAPVSHIPSGLALSSQVLGSASSSAYGIFPNANVGGCSVPLLFSCSPSISSGHIMEAQPQIAPLVASSGAANSYRLVEEKPHQEVHEHVEQAVGQHMEPAHETSHSHQSHA